MKLKQLIVLLLLISGSSFAQSYFGKLKCDSLLITTDSSIAVIYRKNKTAVFNRSINKFLIKPTKGTIFYYKEYHLFAKVDKHGILVSSFNKEKEPCFQIKEESELVLEMSYPDNPFLRVNDIIYNYQTGEIIKSVENYYPDLKIQFNYYPSNLVIVNYYDEPLQGETEFDVDYLIDSGFSKSGVYNLKTHKWTIPNHYKWCEKTGNNILCIKQDRFFYDRSEDDHHGTLRYDNSYYQFLIEKDEMKLIAENCTIASQLDLKNLIGIDSLSGIHSDFDDQSIFIAHKDGLQGLIKLELGGLVKKSSLNFTQLKNYSYSELLPIAYDFILLDYKGLKAISYKKNGVKNIEAYEFIQKKGITTYQYQINQILTAEKEIVFSLNNAESMVSGIDLIADGFHYFKSIQDTIYTLINEAEPFYFNTFNSSESSEFDNNAFGLKIENQGIVQQLFYETDRINPFAEPLQSILYPSEDSLIFDKNTGFEYAVYPPSISGFEKSGLFDTELHKWFVNPNYKLCFQTANGYLLESIDRSFSSYSDFRYSFLTTESNFIFQNQTFEQVFADEEKIKKCIADINTIELLPFPEKILPWSYTEISAPYYYALDKDNKWSVVAPNKNGFSISPYPIFTQKDFVHYNPSYHFFFWLENDSIYINIKNSTASVSQKTGKISLIIAQSEHEYIITLEDKGGKTIVKSRGFDKAEGISLQANIFVQNNQLFVNDVASYNNLDLYWEYFEIRDENLLETNEFLSYSTEMASIWKLENEIWTKKTPFYEFVEPIPFGSLVKTAKF